MATRPEPAAHPQGANPSAPDLVTFAVNPRTLSIEEKSRNIPITTTNPIVVGSAGAETTKRSLGITIALAAVVFSSGLATILYGASIAVEKSEARRRYSGYAVVPIGAVALSTLWGILALVFSRLLKIRIHPAFFVAFDLILWLVIFSVVPLVVVLLAATFVDRFTCDGYSRYHYDDDDYCPNYIAKNWRIQVAASVFGVISGLLHFGIFVWGCVMTHRINRQKKFEVTINLNDLHRQQLPHQAPQAVPPVVYA